MSTANYCPDVMSRRRVPVIAWLFSAGAGIGLGAVTISLLVTRGTGWFYAEEDAFHYRAIGRDLFGRGAGFVDHAEAAYRFGRVGLPFLGWLLALGRPGAVGMTLIVVNLIAIVAVPGLAATLLDGYGVPPAAGAIAFLPVGLYALVRGPVAEPLMISLILFAFVLDARGSRRLAIIVLAYAVLVKEVAVLALIPWAWRAVRHKDVRALGVLGTALVPYAGWCLWVRGRVGAFPFLAPTIQRTAAFGLPFEGLRATWSAKPPGYAGILALTLVTIVVAGGAAWTARRWPIGGLAASFGLLTLCFGTNALRFSFEIWRLLAPAQVFGLLALAIGWSEHRGERPAFVTLQRVLSTR